MKQIIPFTKNIEFKTMINEITNISIEHDLSLKNDHNISGDFLVTGKYKVSKSSPNNEDFAYKIPIDIDIDENYETSNLKLDIDDFKYNQTDSNVLTIDLDLLLDNLEKKEEIEVLNFDDIDTRKILTEEEKQEINNIISIDNTTDLFKETSKEKEIMVKEEKEVEYKEENKNVKTNVGSLFEAFKNTEETFKTYSVYIIREGDNIEEIISKYSTTREELEEYNDMSNIKIGMKLIIPNIKNENN